MTQTKLLPTTVVGSYPQPDWLVDRAMLSKTVPRVRMDIWRVPEQWLEQAQDDATIVAIRDMERAGIDIITDGEIRRESYSNRFATALEGIDLGQARNGPGPQRPGHAGAARCRPRSGARARSRCATCSSCAPTPTGSIKITLPGPFTMRAAGQERVLQGRGRDGDGLRHRRQRRGPRAEGGRRRCHPARRAVAAGNDPEAAKRVAVKAINRALEGLHGPTIVHLCFGYAACVARDKPIGYSFLPELAATKVEQISIEAAQPKLDLGVLDGLGDKTVLLGVIDLDDPKAETPQVVADRIRAALEFIPADRLIPAPDCGMKYLPRAVAFAKLKALAEGAADRAPGAVGVIPDLVRGIQPTAVAGASGALDPGRTSAGMTVEIVDRSYRSQQSFSPAGPCSWCRTCRGPSCRPRRRTRLP